MIRVALADDHSIIREGLRQILAANTAIEIVGEAANGQETIDLVARLAPHILVLDLAMPGRSGIELLKQIREAHPRTAVLVLSMYKENEFAVRAIRAGASGYLTKECAGSELLGAIARIVAGKLYISPAVAECLAQDLQTDGKAPHCRLTDREYQIFGLLVAGHAVSRIAQDLDLSVKTVSTHKARILEKLQVESTAELVRYAMANQLFDLDRD